MNLLRLVLFVVLGIIVWRMVRIAFRSMQAPRDRGGEDPFASHPPQKKRSDVQDIRDADFEDITDTTPPNTPPPQQ